MYERFDWPDYQAFMHEEWFEDAAIYSPDVDCYFIPVNLILEDKNSL